MKTVLLHASVVLHRANIVKLCVNLLCFVAELHQFSFQRWIIDERCSSITFVLLDVMVTECFLFCIIFCNISCYVL